jgi:hypothetical protein
VCAITVASIVGLGWLQSNPPSVIDAITGATPKSKASTLADTYVIGASDLETVQRVCEILKGGESTLNDLTVSVSRDDIALMEYLSNNNLTLATYSDTMLRSRVHSGKFCVFIADSDILLTSDLDSLSYTIVSSSEMG